MSNAPRGTVKILADHRNHLHAAFPHLRRRLALSTQARIDTARAAGDFRLAERIAWEWHNPAAAAAERTACAAHRHAAGLASVPLDDRIGH